jgi:acyl-CoA dehydrogenase
VTSAEEIGNDVAEGCADEVDRLSRYPVETIDALRGAGGLGALVPEEWGGSGATLDVTSAAVAAISRHCASSGLILAMHHIQAVSVVRHAEEATNDEILPRVASGELLLASANSEVGLGGERRASICALEPTEGGFRLDKQASTVSYGEYAEGILATARRDPEAAPNDQVMAVCLRPHFSLEPTGDWDTMGLRGTCSPPCRLVAELPTHLVIPDYGSMFTRTVLPVSTVLLSSVWWGIAEGAAARAHAFVRGQARKRRQEQSDTSPPPSALRLAELTVPLHQLREVVAGGAAEYERHKNDAEIESLTVSSRMDLLKLSASVLVGEITQRAMAICGLAGYANGTPFSIARFVRDGASAPLMINNDRSLHAQAQALLVRRQL